MNGERGRRRLLVVSDRKKGHIHQSLAVARRLGEPVVVEVSLARWKAVLLNALAVVAHLLGKRACEMLAVVARIPLVEAKSSGAQAVVSAGQTVVGCTLLLKRALGIPAIIMMKPTAMPHNAFEVIVAPAHDFTPEVAARQNVVSVPVALSEPLAGAVKKDAETKGMAVAFLVGGDTRGRRLNPQVVLEATNSLLRWASQVGARVLVTTSRRTPPTVSTSLKAILRNHPSLTEAVFADESDANPVADYLSRARYIIVTDDSFSMVSEAVLSGRVPFILETGIYRKFRRSYEELVKRGWARMGPVSAINEYLRSDPGESHAHHIIEDAVDRMKRILNWA